MAKGKVFSHQGRVWRPGANHPKGEGLAQSLIRPRSVVYDALVNPQLLDWTKPGAVKIFVGKRGGQHAKEQKEINDILVKQALRGRLVARQTGGDPLRFGRGGEEAAYLHEHHIAFEIIPGVTSASGAAAYAGIPLTDRRLSSMITMVTGHEGEGKNMSPVEWSRISRKSTLVIFMGLDQLPTITERLLHHLWDANLPAAVIRWGSTAQQEIVEGVLGDIAKKAQEAKMTSPVLIIIGDVVRLRKKIRWFDTKPLFGRKIVITRTLEQAPEFARLLEETGAEIISFPTIQILPPKNWEAADQAIRDITQYDWLLFTSVNGVRAFFNRLKILGGDIRELKGIRIGAIGPKTSGRLTDFGLKVDAFPDEYRAEALADVIGQVKDCRVLLARAAEARDVLPRTLQDRGAAVTIAPVYRTIKTRRIAGDVKKRLLAQEIDVVTFTSSSTVDGFMQHFSSREKRRIFEKTKAAAIGPITASTLKGYGVRPSIRASSYTVEALSRAIVKYFV